MAAATLDADRIRAALTDPVRLCDSLGLSKGAVRQARGLLICCPVHGEKRPSCSVRSLDGGIGVRCFACDFSGDAFTLIAAVTGLDARSQFGEVLAEAARIAGIEHLVATESRASRPRLPPKAVSKPTAAYPDQQSVMALWASCGRALGDHEAAETLRARRINPKWVDGENLARVITAETELPGWARYRGLDWRQTGHRLIVKVYDCDGQWQSVRAWRVVDNDTPKRLPPGGCRAAGLVLANKAGAAMLRGHPAGMPIIIVEGEPDWLVWSLSTEEPVLGILSGSWHDGFASRMPHGAQVEIRTHNDRAGDKYALDILETIDGRCETYRGESDIGD